MVLLEARFQLWKRKVNLWNEVVEENPAIIIIKIHSDKNYLWLQNPGGSV